MGCNLWIGGEGTLVMVVLSSKRTVDCSINEKRQQSLGSKSFPRTPILASSFHFSIVLQKPFVCLFIGFITYRLIVIVSSLIALEDWLYTIHFHFPYKDLGAMHSLTLYYKIFPKRSCLYIAANMVTIYT